MPNFTFRLVSDEDGYLYLEEKKDFVFASVWHEIGDSCGKAGAAEIVRRWNAYPELLKVCERLILRSAEIVGEDDDPAITEIKAAMKAQETDNASTES